MNKQDEKLDLLLRSQPVAKAASDFTSDIMQMISDTSMVEVPLLKEGMIPTEQAPKHMTNLVLESIHDTRSTKFKLLTEREKRNLIVASLLILLSSGIMATQMPWATIIDLTGITSKFKWTPGTLSSNVLLLIVPGTLLWILDQQFRPSKKG